jgi:dual specificity tyrosine-phosphorylation-regulated kinase 2/3/4
LSTVARGSVYSLVILLKHFLPNRSTVIILDSTGEPRPVVNSKGRRRRPGTKTLGQVLRCDDELFIDFVSKCLMWDPERRLKPQSAMRHPFMSAFRRTKVTAPVTPSRTSVHSSSSTSRSKLPSETPKKSLIGAPTPLSARLARAPTASISATPISHAVSNGISTRLSRGTDAFQSSTSRALSGFAVSSWPAL